MIGGSGLENRQATDLAKSSKLVIYLHLSVLIPLLRKSSPILNKLQTVAKRVKGMKAGHMRQGLIKGDGYTVVCQLVLKGRQISH